MKFYYLNTCTACPEQYDVYRENGTLCGYIRLRWGNLYAEYPNIDGLVIYDHNFDDDFKGMFEDDEERDKYLSEIAICYKEAILDGIPTDISNDEVTYEILTDIKELEERLNNG